MPMNVLANPAIIVLMSAVLLIALVLAGIFVMVVVGTRQEHPTDLGLRPTYLAALARRVLGMSVRRDEIKQHTDAAPDSDRATR
jgi:hypothetical protein